ncbi:hypothetical protein AA18895_0994 [Acetobacter ghanensis DSM 18895]|nr:hypothetical protein AA18895_0994 [Acetobacter ghanensis DSM 18895]
MLFTLLSSVHTCSLQTDSGRQRGVPAPCIHRDSGVTDKKRVSLFPFSFIRTVTVGPGIAPDLLTLPKQALAGLRQRTASLPPVGNYTLP